MNSIAEDLERYRRGPELLATLLTGVAGEEADFVRAPGKWSIRQIVAHVADTELVLATRMRFIIAEDSPALGGFDQDAWAANLDYARRKPGQSLETFRRLRAENFELLKELPESGFDRVGIHSVRGPESLRKILQTYTDHAEKHARQLQEIRDEYKKVKGKK